MEFSLGLNRNVCVRIGWHYRLQLTFCPMGCEGRAAAPPLARPRGQTAGTIKSISGIPDFVDRCGVSYSVSVGDAARFFASTGWPRDLKNASPLTLSDLQVETASW